MRTNLSMVFQQFNLWSHMSILQNVIEAPITVLGQDRAEVEARGQALLEKVFRGRMSDLLLDALQVFNAKDRLGILATVFERFRAAHDEKQGRIDVHVTTAVPLTDELRTKVSAAVRKRTSKTARLIETTDPDILGGLIVRIGDTKIDTSVANHLRRMRDALRTRASVEIHGGRSYFEGA